MADPLGAELESGGTKAWLDAIGGSDESDSEQQPDQVPAPSRSTEDWLQAVSSPTGPVMTGVSERDPISAQLSAAGTMERGPRARPPGAWDAAESGAAHGAAEGGAFVGGASLAFRSTPFLPPLPRVGATILGGVAGSIGARPLTDQAFDVIGIPGYEDIPQAYRRYFVGAETFTASLFPAAGSISMAKAGFRLKGVSSVGKWFNKNLDKVSKQPWSATMKTEATASLSAGFAAVAAEASDPGDALTRFAAETVAGAVNPARWGEELLRFAWFRSRNAVLAMAPKRISGAFPEKAARIDAARYLKSLFDETGIDGDDINGLVEVLSKPGVLPDATTSQLTGSIELTALKHALVSRSSVFGLKVQKRTEKALETTGKLVDALMSTGDPSAMVAASELRRAYTRTMLDGLFEDGKLKARIAVEKLSRDSPRDSRQISKIASDVIDDARRVARDIERPLYESIDNVTSVTPLLKRDFLSAIKDSQRSLTPEDIDELPKYFKSFIKRMKEGGEMTAKDFTSFRSKMGDLASKAGDSGEMNKARLLSNYADAALKTLDDHFEAIDDPAYDIARSFTREFHESFTRSFAGEIRETSGGGRVINPEMVLRRAMATGGDATDIRLQDLEDATRFLVSVKENDELSKAVTMAMGDYDPEQAMATMLNAQERMLRLVLTEGTDPVTGRAKHKLMADFIRKNENLLDRMPGLRDDLNRIIDSELSLMDLEKNIPAYGMPTEMPPGVGIDAPTAKLAELLGGVDRPSVVVAEILRSDSPVKGLTRLSAIAKGDNEAITGLRAAIMEGIGDTVDKKLTTLRSSTGDGAPSLMDQMLKNGIIDKDIHQNLTDILKAFDNIISDASTHGAVPLPGDESTVTSLLSSALARLGGLRAFEATGLAPGGGGSISAYQAAGQISQKMLDKMPHERQIKMLERAILDPAFGKDMLADISKLPEKEVFRLMGRVHGYLMRAGLIPVIREEDDAYQDRGLSQEELKRGTIQRGTIQ